ncbi:MAG: hypothetical protein JSV62_13495 [Promethearchaeota archaeon]|nr:MAG: hypothetical protein JSV62_13495 [Candidatus Lokiarchaeota archaeon]
MSFAVPRKNNSEMLLYIWKIIDLPFITYDDLLYTITFELFILPPENAKDFITTCIKNKFLVKENNYLKLSEELNQKLKFWQKKRANEILGKISEVKKINQLKDDIDKKDTTNFSALINAFVDKGTLNRSVSVADAAFEKLEYDISKGMLTSKIKGSKEDSYLIEINTNNKIIRHNCHDFETRRADNKKFCKHLAKLFLLLKNKNENVSEFFLSEIARDIDIWDFTT